MADVITYREAVAEGIAREMRRDPTVVCLGEDIGAAEGVFKTTVGLLDEFGADRVWDTPISEQAIVGGHRTVSVALEEYQKVAAAAHDRRVATVWVANELTDADRERLQAALSRQYGHQVHLNVIVEPELLGGMRVEIGDDVIDGTVRGRLEDARRRLAG